MEASRLFQREGGKGEGVGRGGREKNEIWKNMRRRLEFHVGWSGWTRRTLRSAKGERAF